MKKLQTKTFLIMCFMMMISNIGFSEIVSPAATQSLEMQQVNLAERVRKTFEYSISKIMSSSKYIVNVKIETDAKSKVKKPKSKTLTALDKEGVKFNNQVQPSGKDDYILFSKLGLEAPLIKDEDNAKRENLKKTIVEINETFDIFNNLKKINVDIFLSDKLDPTTRKNIEDIIMAVQLNISTKPSINIKYISMKEGTVPESVLSNKLDQLIALASKFSTPLGLVLAVLIFSLMAFILFRKYSALQERHWEFLKTQKTHALNTNQNKDESKDKKSANGMPNLISEEESIKAFERFMLHYEQNNANSILMIKKWIKDEGTGPTFALNALVKQMNNKNLKQVFEQLTIEERKIWKSKLKNDLTEEEVRMGNSYISEQIIEDIMAPPLIQDSDILKIINQLTPAQGADMIKKNMEIGSVLLNIMPPVFVSSLLESIPESQIDELIEQSSLFDEDMIKLRIPELKKILPNMQLFTNKSPFVENIFKHIEFSKPKTEKTLFKTLFRSEGSHITIQVAISHLPSDIIGLLSDKIVKQSLLLMPQAQRINFIYSLEGELKNHFTEIVAPIGSKTRDLFDLEFEKIQSDAALQEDIDKNRETYLTAYHYNVRKYVRNTPEAIKEVTPLITEWVTTLQNDLTKASEEESEEGVTRDVA